MKPNSKQIQDPRDIDPFYAETMSETPEQRDALIEEMYDAHLKEEKRKSKEDPSKKG
jgi:hypothetical protein